MAEQIRKDVAVFIDFENIYVSVRDKLDANPNFEIIMDHCNELGRVILARAFADWYRYPRITSALYANNIEPIYVPTYYYDKDAGRTGRPIKNSVDMNLCIDAMRTLFTMPQLSTFVLITGDRDFIPLVNSIRQQGKDVIIIGVGGAASTHLAQSADEFIFYEQLVGKPLPQAAQPGHGRRIADIDEFERDRTGRDGRDRSAATSSTNGRAAASPSKPERKASGLSEDQVFALLAKAVVEARSRNMLTAFGSLKVLMRELSNGDFREQLVRDANGKPIERFKDFIYEAARRGVVVISSDGVVNEVFLPGEDPAQVSQFTQSETVTTQSDDGLALPVVAAAPAGAAESDVKSSVNEKTRRRRRRGERNDEPTTAVVVAPEVAVVGEPESLVVPDMALASDPVSESLEPIADMVPFSDDERKLVRVIVAASARPMSFQQIYDALRGGRNRGTAQHPPRTNEELRSLVKLSINGGELQRIGRGNRVSYRLPAQPSDSTVPAPVVTEVSTDDQLVDMTPVDDAPAAASTTSTVMIPTPEDHDDALLPPVVVTTPAPVEASVTTGQLEMLPMVASVEVATPAEPKTPATKPKTPAKKRSTTSRKTATKESAAPVAETKDAPVSETAPAKKPRRRTTKKSEGEA